MFFQVRGRVDLPRNMGTFLFDTRGANKMQFDYMEWLLQYGIYAVAAIGALIIAVLARSRLAKATDDKLKSPSYEEMDSGIKLSDPDDEEDEP